MADLGGFGAGLESEGGREERGSSPRWLWWVEGGEGERWREREEEARVRGRWRRYRQPHPKTGLDSGPGTRYPRPEWGVWPVIVAPHVRSHVPNGHGPRSLGREVP